MPSVQLDKVLVFPLHELPLPLMLMLMLMLMLTLKPLVTLHCVVSSEKLLYLQAASFLIAASMYC